MKKNIFVAANGVAVTAATLAFCTLANPVMAQNKPVNDPGHQRRVLALGQAQHQHRVRNMQMIGEAQHQHRERVLALGQAQHEHRVRNMQMIGNAQHEHRERVTALGQAEHAHRVRVMQYNQWKSRHHH